jgi:hypothetical protein
VQSLGASGGEVPSKNFSPGVCFYSTASPIKRVWLGLFCVHTQRLDKNIKRTYKLIR